MTKNNLATQTNEATEVYFTNSMDEACYDEESVTDLVNTLLSASNKQMELAFELTRLIVESTDKDMKADDIFATFNKASDTIAEKFPLKAMWDKYATNEAL